MATIKAAILGFGTVGQGIYHILNEKREELKNKLGLELEVAKILVTDASRERVPGTAHLMTENIDDIFEEQGLQVVFEAIVNEEPAYTYLKRAIENKCHVITANKVMFAKHGLKLQELAKEYGVFVGYEATTAGGVPVIKTMKNILLVNDVSRIQGILNGTSNYILTKMRAEGWTFEDALKEAQKLGYAEADPYNDVSGQDAFKKIMILSALAFGEQPDWDNVDVIGIDSISAAEVEEATAKGLRYRHVAEVEKREDGSIFAKVGPMLVDAEHPLYPVDDVNNAVALETNYIGTLSLVGPGAGMYPTASVMVEDYAEIIGKRAGFVVRI
ncbi:MAG TPA: homoserine dehydrogenase [Metalysinibacillus jejuensis]|jgi:homoserine dehydrogenase|uniref:Homoserine dehydrogenase n=1 Tax=Metalysinibacillus jejuensis TaxID=914327 RepID=A0A921NB96_9BACL|nr:homoserine dehydrogenase [Metalysinibacillus jejuensis]HJH10695.1 homoserine dehydrogenase [Metalysinibacillus jejuensis]